MKADRGMEKGHEGTADRKGKKNKNTQVESIVVQSVSHAKLCADIIKQGQGFLRKYAPVSYKA